MILLGQYIQLQSRNLVQETEFVPVISFQNFWIKTVLVVTWAGIVEKWANPKK